MRREWALLTWLNNLEDQIDVWHYNMDQKYKEMGIMI